MDPHDSEMPPREWKRWLDRCRQMSEDWARLLAHDLPAVSQARRPEVAAEFHAFALQRARLRLRRKGIPVPEVALLRGTPDLRPVPARSPTVASASAKPRAGASTPARVPASRSASAPPPVPGARAAPHAVTEAMLARFRRLTGFEGREVSGSPESQADFLLSVIVFSLLTEGAAVPDWQMNQLLKRIRWCREELVAHVRSLDGLSSPRWPEPPRATRLGDRRALGFH